jgi:CheY-like chemotaxis protein
MRKRILFVDEEFALDTDEELGSYMSYYAIELTDAGYEVTRCPDVDGAIAAIREQSFDLIILDGTMPAGDALKDDPVANGGYTGWVLAEQVHTMKPDTPVIMLTNYPEFRERFGDLIERGVVSRVVSKLEKTPSELAVIIDAIFSGSN